MSSLTCLTVGGEHLRDRGWMRLRGRCKHSFNCTCDPRELDPPLQERSHRNFIRGIQRNRVIPTLFRCLKSQPQAREALEVGLSKVEMAKRRKITFEVSDGLAGGASYDKHGTPLTDETMAQAQEADAKKVRELIPTMQPTPRPAPPPQPAPAPAAPPGLAPGLPQRTR